MTNSPIKTRPVVIPNKLGMHARAAATLVKLATGYEARVTISNGRQTADGKSILGLLTLAAVKGTTVTVTCAGPDADAAMIAVIECIEGNFGEPE